MRFIPAVSGVQIPPLLPECNPLRIYIPPKASRAEVFGVLPFFSLYMSRPGIAVPLSPCRRNPPACFARGGNGRFLEAEDAKGRQQTGSLPGRGLSHATGLCRPGCVAYACSPRQPWLAGALRCLRKAVLCRVRPRLSRLRWVAFTLGPARSAAWNEVLW